MAKVEAPKGGLEGLIDRLKKIKKKPEDWIFVPRRKKFKKCKVMLEDGESVLVSDGSGSFKPQIKKRPTMVTVSEVKAFDKDGKAIGGYKPKAEGEWTAEDVLEDMLAMSLNPACEVVPYEGREVGKEAKDAEMNLVEERRKRLDAEEKLKALEDGKEKDAARMRELEDQLSELTKPGKK